VVVCFTWPAVDGGGLATCERAAAAAQLAGDGRGPTSDSGVGLGRAPGSHATAGSRGSHRWARRGRTTPAHSSAASFAMAERGRDGEREQEGGS
jgi:hypothetical protein